MVKNPEKMLLFLLTVLSKWYIGKEGEKKKIKSIHNVAVGTYATKLN